MSHLVPESPKKTEAPKITEHPEPPPAPPLTPVVPPAADPEEQEEEDDDDDDLDDLHDDEEEEAPVRRRTPRRRPELTEPQKAVILELICGATITQAAEAGQVDRRTVHRWIASDLNFRRELEAIKQTRWAEAQAELGALTSEALACLKKSVQDPDAPAYVRLKAASTILGHINSYQW